MAKSNFFGWFNRFFQTEESAPHPQQLANWNTLNRRKNFRVGYSHIGPVGELPRVFFKNDEVVVKNISTGGLLIIDDTEMIGNNVGVVVPLTLKWANYECTLQCRVVAAQLQRRHLQFHNFDAEVFQRISRLIRPAFIGSRFHRVDSGFNMKEAQEFWTGSGRDNLVITKGNSSHVFHVNGGSFEFHHQLEKWKDSQSKTVSHEVLSEILVMLANFPNPSSALKTLIEKSQAMYAQSFELQDTGTDGSN